MKEVNIEHNLDDVERQYTSLEEEEDEEGTNRILMQGLCAI